MRELRRAWHDMGRTGFLSTPVLWTFLAWAIPSTLYTEVAASGAPLLPWLGASTASSLTVALLLWVAARVVPRRWIHGPGPWVAAAVYLSAGALRGMLLWTTAEALGLLSTVGLASRMTNSAAWSIAAMGCASIVVARRSQHQKLMTGLADRRRELLALQSSLETRIEQTRVALTEQVRDELGPTLAQLHGELDALSHSTDPGVDGAVERFRAAVTQVVRPLSRTLAEARSQPSLISSPAASPDPPPAAERIAAAEVIGPAPSAGLVLLLLALLALAVAPQDYRTADAPLRVLTFVVILWVGLQALRWVAQRAGSQATAPVLLASLAAAYLALGYVVGLITRAATSELAAQAMTFPALVVVLAAAAPLFVSMALTWQTLARTAELRSAETVAELDVLTAVLRRELWRERRRMALTVHGPVQSALVAAAVALARPHFSVDQVPMLVESLEHAMAHIERAAGPQPPIESAVRDLAALWMDSASISLAADRAVTDLVNGDDMLRTVLIEILREAVSNAVRHGAADTVCATILRPSRGVLRMTIEDDGDGPPSNAVPGLGSMMLDEVALAWSLSRQGALTLVRVEVALEPLDGSSGLGLAAVGDR